MIRAVTLLSVFLVAAGQAQEPRRVALTLEELEKELAKPETPPLVRVPLADLDKRLASGTASSKDSRPLLVESNLQAVWTPDGKGGHLAGSAVWRFRSAGGGPAWTAIEPMQLAASSPRWDDGKPARMTVIDSALKLLVPGDRSLRFDWSLAGTREPGEFRFDIQTPAAAMASLQLDLPAELRPFVLQEALLEGPFPARHGSRSWRLVHSGQTRLAFSIRPEAELSTTAVKYRSANRQVIAAGRVNLDYDLDLEIGRAGSTELLVDFDPALAIQEVAINKRRDWTVSESPVAGKKRLRVRFLEPTRGGRLQLRATAPLPPEDTLWTSPALTVVRGLAMGESLELRLGPEWREEGFQAGIFRVLEDWRTLPDGTRSIRLESAFAAPGLPAARPSLRRVLRGGEFDIRQNLVWRADASRQTLDQEIEPRVLFGTMGQLVVRIPVGWEVERVSLPGTDQSPEWTVRGADVAIDPAKGWAVGSAAKVDIRYRRTASGAASFHPVPASVIKGARVQFSRLSFAPGPGMRFVGDASLGPVEQIAEGGIRTIEWNATAPKMRWRIEPVSDGNRPEAPRTIGSTVPVAAVWIAEPTARLSFDGSDVCSVLLRGNLRPGAGGKLLLSGWHPDTRLLSVSMNRRVFPSLPAFIPAADGMDLLLEMPAEPGGLLVEIEYETPVRRSIWSAVASRPAPQFLKRGQPSPISIRAHGANGWTLVDPVGDMEGRIYLTEAGELRFRRGNPLLWMGIIACCAAALYASRYLPRRGVVGLLAAASLAGALRAAAEEPEAIRILPAADGDPSKASAYVPLAWWNGTAPKPAAPHLTRAGYSAWVREGTLELAIEWELDAEAGTVFPFALPESHLRSMTRGGRPVHPRALGADRYEVDIPEAGTALLRLVVDVPIAEKGGERESRFAIPEHPTSRCAFFVPPDARSFRFAARRGGICAVPTPLGLCMVAELGRARAVQPVWGVDAPMPLEAREAHIAEIEADSATLTSAWECGKSGVSTLRAKLIVPAEWEPFRMELRSDAPTAVRVLDWRLGPEAGGYRDCIVDLSVDPSQAFRLVVESAPAKPLNRRMTLRLPQWPESGSRDAWFGFQLKGWEAATVEARQAVEAPVDPVWKDSCRAILGAVAAQVPDRLFRRAPKGQWSIRLELKEPPAR